MEIGFEHLFYAFALFWLLHAGYLLNLIVRQKRLADELKELKELTSKKSSP